MNLANKLTILRIVLVLPFTFFLKISYASERFWFFNIVATIIFLLAMITDYFDGKIARETNTITEFGKLLDPLADKILVFSFLLIALKYNRISLIYIFIIFAREILITYERIYLSKKNLGIMPASNLGKAKTVSFAIFITIALLFRTSYQVNNVLIIIPVILTILSAFDYHKEIIKYLEV